MKRNSRTLSPSTTRHRQVWTENPTKKRSSLKGSDQRLTADCSCYAHIKMLSSFSVGPASHNPIHKVLGEHQAKEFRISMFAYNTNISFRSHCHWFENPIRFNQTGNCFSDAQSDDSMLPYVSVYRVKSRLVMQCYLFQFHQK